ncbi:MAG: histidine kinase [Rhodobacteraceae bacterium]|nr:histidine kinase [Paracoccaceae bacterium]
MGRIAILAILVVCAIGGGALYYLQVYYYYEELAGDQVDNVQLTTLDTAESQNVMFENFKGIDSTSSPIRYRACFDLAEPLADLATRFAGYPAAEPLVAPSWFDCFDADQIGADIAADAVETYLSIGHVQYGIDRVIAVYPDGSAFAWHQINHCGAAKFNGEPIPDDCPPPPEGQ